MRKNNNVFDGIAFTVVVMSFLGAFVCPLYIASENPEEVELFTTSEKIIPESAIKMFDMRDVDPVGEIELIDNGYHLYPCDEIYFSADINSDTKEIEIFLRGIDIDANKTFDYKDSIPDPEMSRWWGYSDNGKLSSLTKEENGSWVIGVTYEKSNMFFETLISLFFGIVAAVVVLVIFLGIEKILISKDWTSWLKSKIKWKE
jgi:hypothetical protein